jgi:hypothetical protein
VALRACATKGDEEAADFVVGNRVLVTGEVLVVKTDDEDVPRREAFGADHRRADNRRCVELSLLADRLFDCFHGYIAVEREFGPDLLDVEGGRCLEGSLLVGL